jgi:hypothetical protein
MRRIEPKRFVKREKSAHRTRSKTSAGPPSLQKRCVISEIEIGIDLDSHPRKLLCSLEIVDIAAQVRKKTGATRRYRFHRPEPDLPQRKDGIMSDSPYIGPRTRRPYKAATFLEPERSYPGDSPSASTLVQTHHGDTQIDDQDGVG